ncbi:MAG: RnfABCDGE type electron transport complex subunit B [Pseudomonadota bacterium]
MTIVTAAVFLGALGALLATMLIVAAKKFYVYEDPRIAQVEYALPGANCGGCGFPGCSGFARHVVESRDPDALCPPGGAEVQAAVAAILGMAASAAAPKTAQVRCKGTDAKALSLGTYLGIHDCTAADLVMGGHKVCPYGCLGLGTCVKACQFGALSIVDGIAIVDEGKCTGCTKCVAECPRGIINMLDKGPRVVVDCHSADKGNAVKKYCQVGCFTCMICVKKCPDEAISVVKDIVVIDPQKCTHCGICIGLCPQDVINGYHGAGAQPPADEAAAAEVPS